MLKPTCITPKCTNPHEISRYHSPCSRNTREITKLSVRSLVLLPKITEPTSPRVIQMKIPTLTAINELLTTNGGTLLNRRVEPDGLRNSNGTRSPCCRAMRWRAVLRRRKGDAAGRSRRGSGGGNCGGGRLTAGQPRQQPDWPGTTRWLSASQQQIRCVRASRGRRGLVRHPHIGVVGHRAWMHPTPSRR